MIIDGQKVFIGDVHFTIIPECPLATILREDEDDKDYVLVYNIRYKRCMVLPKNAIKQLLIPIEQDDTVEILRNRLQKIYESTGLEMSDFCNKIGLSKRLNRADSILNIETVEVKLLASVANAFNIPIEELCCTHKITKYD